MSGDGSTIVFDSDQALLPGASDLDNAYDVATGALTLITGGIGGGGAVTSISADGTEIAVESYYDLDGNVSPSTDFERSYIFNTSTGAVTAIDGFGSLGPATSVSYYFTAEPQLSADGTSVAYTVTLGHNITAFERNLVTGVVTQLTPTGQYDYNEQSTNATLNADGTYVAYLRNEYGQDPNEVQGQIFASSLATVASASGDYDPGLTASGNAVTFTANFQEYSPGYYNTAAYERTFGVTAGIGAVGHEDEIDAAGLAAIKAAGSIAFTGATNAPVGSLVSLQIAVEGSSPGPAITGDVTAPGVWTVVVPADTLGADGEYIVAVTVDAPAGASPRVIRTFTLDTAAPATPDTPKLDAGSDTGVAHDGTMTDTDTPTVTGTAEAGSVVTLIDRGGLTPGLVLGTGIANGNGVYAITSRALT